MLHDGTSRKSDGFRGLDASTGEVWGMEVVEPDSDLIRGGVGKKEANLASNMLLVEVNIQVTRSRR